jgi:hypothetical protein
MKRNVRQGAAAGCLGTTGVWLLAAGLTGCAGPETGTAATARAPVYERSDNATGSNLPRKANKPSNVLVVDPEAMQGAARGATRNGGAAAGP